MAAGGMSVERYQALRSRLKAEIFEVFVNDGQGRGRWERRTRWCIDVDGAQRDPASLEKALDVMVEIDRLGKM